MVDRKTASWLDDMIAWWIRALGPVAEVLVRPTDEHFPDRTPEGLFAACVRYADMTEWNLELVDDDHLSPAAIGDDFDPDEHSGFLPEGGPYPVSYSRDDSEVAMIASFARALSHYLLYSPYDELLAGDDERQALVDIGAVMMGLGIFIVNGAVTTADDGAGGRSIVRVSALDDDSLGYVLAMFAELRDLDDDIVLAHLAPIPRAAFRAGREQLRGRRSDVVVTMRAIVPTKQQVGPYR